MKISHPHRHSHVSANQSMTSMIDMVFLLLIFFICLAANQVPEWELHSTLASGNQSAIEVPGTDQPAREMIWIKALINQQGMIGYQVNDNPLPTLVELQKVLRQLHEIVPEGQIVMQIEDAVPLQSSVALHDAIRQTGFEALSLGLPATTRSSNSESK